MRPILSAWFSKYTENWLRANFTPYEASIYWPIWNRKSPLATKRDFVDWIEFSCAISYANELECLPEMSQE